MFSESLSLDLRYAVRGMRRTPLFSLTVASTIGLGLGILCSAFTIVNAYLLAPLDLPRAHELYALSWDSATVRRHAFTLPDYEALRETTPHFSDVAALRSSRVMFNGRLAGVTLVTGNFFPMLGAPAMLGRTLTPGDATAPGSQPVVVLSEPAWRTRFGADPEIVGQRITLGRQSFDVVGVLPQGFGLTGSELVSFWVPLTMARAFTESDPWTNGASVGSLEILGRLREDASLPQVRSWLDTFLRQRLPAGSNDVPTTIHVESRATRIPLTGTTLTMFSVLLAAFGSCCSSPAQT